MVYISIVRVDSVADFKCSLYSTGDDFRSFSLSFLLETETASHKLNRQQTLFKDVLLPIRYLLLGKLADDFHSNIYINRQANT